MIHSPSATLQRNTVWGYCISCSTFAWDWKHENWLWPHCRACVRCTTRIQHLTV